MEANIGNFADQCEKKLGLRRHLLLPLCATIILFAALSSTSKPPTLRHPSTNNEIKKYSTHEILPPEEETQEGGECEAFKPSKIKLNEQYIWLNHIGKAGGGTFENRMTSKWNVKMHECHPFPCRNRFPNKSGFILAHAHKTDISQIPGSFIVVRDPVDRFVSAFNWRGLLLCHPNREDKRDKKLSAFDDPEMSCEKYKKENKEVQIIFNKYNENINNLAEKLCDENPKIQKEARDDIKKIRHLKNQMHEFLPANWAENELVYKRLIPVVLEPGFDFNLMTDEAIEYGLEKFNILSKDQIETHKSYIDCMENNDNAEKTKQSAHSSANSKSESFLFRNHKFLGRAGLECVASYFHRDYDFLEQLLYKGCKSEDCVNAIESILERRASLLGPTEAEAEATSGKND